MLSSDELAAALQPSSSTVNFIDETLPEQAAFIRDRARLKLAFSTRRGGKSYGVGRLLLKASHETPNVSCLYIALTRDSAENIMWRDVLKRLNDELLLGGVPNESKLRLALPNGSTVRLLGMDANENEKRKLLGGKYKVVAIDEAASFLIDLKAFIFETIKPAVADLRGTVCLTSTPTNIHAGEFFDLTKDQDPMQPGTWQRDGWSCHRWSYEQNHYIRPQVEEDIAELVRAKPLIARTPGFQQMWKGRWAIDDTKRVYKFAEGRNSFDGVLPPFRTGEWHYVLGIDTGWKASAFSLVAYHDKSPRLHVLESWKRAGMDVTAMAAVVQDYRSRFDIDTVRVDGANKQAVEEMNARHGLTLEAADKKDKFEFIDIMNDDFIQERIVVSTAEWEPERMDEHTDVGRCGDPAYSTRLKCGLLVAEYAKLVVDERKLLKLRKREEHPNCENHCCDATLYPWRYAYPYLSEAEKPLPPKVNTPAWHEAEAARRISEFEAESEREFQQNQVDRNEAANEGDWS